jgi:hypothetical protein
VDHYHIWFNLKDTSKDLEFAQHLHSYLAHLQKGGLIEGYTLARRKLGFGPNELGEFHVDIHVRDLGQLDRAFTAAAARSGVVEELHTRVYEHVTDFRSGLWRDFPDPVRAKPKAPPA